MVAKILGVFWVIVASNAAGELEFGQIPRDEFSRVEGIGFTCLSRRHRSTVDRFFGDLCSEKEISVTFTYLRRRICATYIVPVNLFFTEYLHKLMDFTLCGDNIIGENLPVQGARVGNYPGHIATDVSQVYKGCRRVAITDDLVVAGCHGVVHAPGC